MGSPILKNGIKRWLPRLLAASLILYCMLFCYRSSLVSTTQAYGETLRALHLAEGTEPVRDAVISALGRNDSRYLCGLADPDELQQLHLTPTAVFALLDAGPPITSYDVDWSHMREVGPHPPDYRQWVADVRSTERNVGRFAVVLIDTPHHGWKLALSDLLKQLCSLRYGRSNGTAHYAEWARVHEVDGWILAGSPKTSLAEIASRLNRRAN